MTDHADETEEWAAFTYHKVLANLPERGDMGHVTVCITHILAAYDTQVEDVDGLAEAIKIILPRVTEQFREAQLKSA